jgi:hypothetical protein
MTQCFLIDHCMHCKCNAFMFSVVSTRLALLYLFCKGAEKMSNNTLSCKKHEIIILFFKIHEIHWSVSNCNIFIWYYLHKISISLKKQVTLLKAYNCAIQTSWCCRWQGSTPTVPLSHITILYTFQCFYCLLHMSTFYVNNIYWKWKHVYHFPSKLTRKPR